MPYLKVYIHFVWSTKNRVPFLDDPALRRKFWEHIHSNGKQKEIYIDTVNGYEDHCHCLVSLGADQTIRKVVQLIKGESSHWINKHQLCKYRFEWQDEYFAISVSESVIDKVRNYIRNQEKHHGTKSFDEEYCELIEKCGFNKMKD